jgi:DNA polymerase III delta prime subunit
VEVAATRKHENENSIKTIDIVKKKRKMMMNTEEYVTLRLLPFLETNRVPNILFHGDFDSPKQEVVDLFVSMIYKDMLSSIHKVLMKVDCATEKGIQFIREDIKFFAKTQISSNIFKTVLLLNADFLSLDSQAALRRCIELFCHNTRFFLVMENKNKLMAPMLSRFCEIFVSSSIHSLTKPPTMISTDPILLSIINLNVNNVSTPTLLDLTHQLYQRAYSMQDIMNLFLSKELEIDTRILFKLSQMQRKVRSEETLLFYSLYYYFEYLKLKEKEKDTKEK